MNEIARWPLVVAVRVRPPACRGDHDRGPTASNRFCRRPGRLPCPTTPCQAWRRAWRGCRAWDPAARSRKTLACWAGTAGDLSQPCPGRPRKGIAQYRSTFNLEERKMGNFDWTESPPPCCSKAACLTSAVIRGGRLPGGRRPAWPAMGVRHVIAMFGATVLAPSSWV